MNWATCGDITVKDDDGKVVYDGPLYLRCVYYGCLELVTVGQIRSGGGCRCGRGKYRGATSLSDEEKMGLLNGQYPLTDWEAEIIMNGE